MEFRTFKIAKDDNDRRIDRVVRHFLPKLALSGIYKLLRKGHIRINGKKVHPDYHVLEGSELEISRNLLESVRNSSLEIYSDFVPEILFETKDLLFINKPQGFSVHGTGGLDSLIAQMAASGESLSFRTGPLHCLDRNTTGILTFSRSLEGARWFSESVREHRFEKYYLGLTEGLIESVTEWLDIAEDGKQMITIARPIKSLQISGLSQSLVLFRIVTGRKHQIRIQSSKHGHPLIGDIQYGSKRSAPTYYLHAWQMIFPENRFEGIPKKIIAPVPDTFKAVLRESFGVDVLAYIERGELYWN